MILREAIIDDWEKLLIFFTKIYRNDHPLQNKLFWEWQYGNPKYGRSFICLNTNNEIVGHVGANFQGNIAWIINVYLTEEFRGKGILGRLYDLARDYYPLAATSANEAGLGLYKNMRWIRYYDLVRYVKINPNLKDISLKNVCSEVQVDIKNFKNKDSHYFQQPSIKGIILNGDSEAVSQENVGGLRVVSFDNLQKLENKVWEIGYNWMDYITSWNDLKTIDLEKNGWVLDFKSVVPWRLNPLEENYFCDVTFLSEEPLCKEFIIKRSHSDHGRVGSII
ncbi:GNAT family N-acetyltransferase [Flavobacterium sp. P4023]|uniref:GNAT family N-acetyltransferase n=1 Tax=Flavobacterium flabelliforme TaxID=2816119 RepID=A0ABS5CPG4_9FLAO|nr:GNAT family N-acetyltransferase [Flavobacterium flabelliforme]MBP4140507.1 GNAT family N-acetyltransferase [Flavobacterium flabelliforme]